MIQPTQFKVLLFSCFLAILGSATELSELKEPNDLNPIIPVCDEPEKANEFDGVLVPSFLVSGIVEKLGNANSFDVVASTYMRGFSREIAQVITGNQVADYQTRQEDWFRRGAEDALKYCKNIRKSDSAASYDMLRRFGYQKVLIRGAFSALDELEYGRQHNYAIVYTPKELQSKLKAAVISKGSSVTVSLLAWISPPGVYDLQGSFAPRMIVVEKLIGP